MYYLLFLIGIFVESTHYYWWDLTLKESQGELSMLREELSTTQKMYKEGLESKRILLGSVQRYQSLHVQSEVRTGTYDITGY